MFGPFRKKPGKIAVKQRDQFNVFADYLLGTWRGEILMVATTQVSVLCKRYR